MFVVCGEALMDVYTGAQTPTGLSLDARIGGSPLNVAQGLARLGRPVAAVLQHLAIERYLRVVARAAAAG